MDRALALAERGRGRVEPNPVVGCVLTAGGTLVGEGFHEGFGGAHAEANALAAAGARARGATIYVTLEPCAHTGKKTAPCAPALVRAAPARVVIAVRDPNPQTTGRGEEILRAAGIIVETGLRRKEAIYANASFFKHVRLGLPLVTAKWAMTLDGRIAAPDGSSRWISDETSRRQVHAMRGEVDAVMVGIETALRDDPDLCCRDAEPKRVAVRIVVDSRCRLPLESRLVRTARETPVLIATGPRPDARAAARLEAAGCELMRLPAALSGRPDLGELFARLGDRGMSHVLVEGGPRLLGALFADHLVDRAVVFVAPKLLGGGPGAVEGDWAPTIDGAHQLHRASVQPGGRDAIMIGWVSDPTSWA
jgi:diaminohydroxyphosphoribosylaminopyrimidine deaminase/5-amino-6-(5-phosphoribosylamino)uracil reductase